MKSIMKLNINFNDMLHYFQSRKNIKNIALYSINTLFWIVVFMVLLINSYAAGSIFVYETNHDHHLAFFSFLSGMAANGILPGIDFYSPHSIFIPIIIGIFFKILGVSQVNLGIADGIVIFITMIFIYKTARFAMPNIFAKLAVLTLLLSHSGRDNPWFNDVIMCFVAITIYFFASYIVDKKRYKLIIIGILCFVLPYMRQQGLVISFLFLAMPLILFYMHQIRESQYKTMTKNIVISFFVANIVFFIFIILRNGFSGLEILFSSFSSLVDMAQPFIGYENNIGTILNLTLNYTSDGMDWHGYFMRFLSYWFIVIIPCLYFVYKPFSLNASKEAILNEDVIKFVVALITLSTIIFNYPINEDARMRVQFGIGIWLFIESLRLCFYNKKIKIISIVAIAIVFLSLNHSKMTQFINKSITNYHNMVTTKDGYYKMGANTPYKEMRFKEDYAQHLQSILNNLESYHNLHPNKKIIFDGELIDINAFLFLLFSGPEIGLQHKFPYYYGAFDREKFFPGMNRAFDEFVSKNKPIVIACESDDRAVLKEQYKILDKINKSCSIFVPKDS